MEMLPLNDPRWKSLNHRGWSNGMPNKSDPYSPFVPDVLTKLINNPADIDCFDALWPYLCSEGTTWSAAYAATPYFVRLASRVVPERRFGYMCVIGLIETYSCPKEGDSFAIKDYLVDGYRSALNDALLLTTETLLSSHEASETRCLLATVSVLKGHRKLAEVLHKLEAICVDCPKCGETIYPGELQEAIL